jgi:neutral ceramidase
MRLLVLPLLLLACSPALLREPAAPSAAPRPSAGFRAGLDEIDITPQPGLTLFGYGAEGRIARGHRGRLRCRSLVAIDARGESLAWAVCDLGAASGLLHARISARILKSSGIGADRFILSATHTHAGPAHYFAARSQGGPLRSANPGFDERLVDWLAERIARSVARAKADALAHGEAKLDWHFGKLSERSTANRSLNPHCSNSQPMGNLPSSCGTDAAVYEDVDRTLSVLRVERDAKVIGLFAVLGMHPTALPNTNELYHADVFGIAARRLHYWLPDQPLVALANGIGGDVSPVVSRQSWPEAERVGAQLADDVRAVVELPGTTGLLEIQRAYREVTLGLPGLCAEGAFGRASASGPDDGRTRYDALPDAHEGNKLSEPEGCHGIKHVWEEAPSRGTWAFPRFVPMTAARLGGALLVWLPFEPTTTPGLLLRQQLEKDTREPVVLVGLSNEHLGYVTTAKEYEQQHYEGASVVYGPKSSEFFAQQVNALVVGLDAPARVPALNLVRAHELSPAPRVHVFEPGLPERTRQIVRQPFQAERTQRGMAIEWRVSDSTFFARDGREAPVADGVLVSIERKGPDGKWRLLQDELGAPIDDTGTAVWVKQRRSRENHYVAVWQPSRKLSGRFRFVVGRSVGVVRSKEFEL